MKTLEDIIRQAIERNPNTYYRIAVDSGVPHSVLLRFVNGERSVSLATADKLCKYLGLELRIKG